MSKAEIDRLLIEHIILKAAAQDVAEAEAIPNDAAAFIWCREVAQAALREIARHEPSEVSL